MAKEKLDFREPDDSDKPYLVKSSAQVDLERRLDEDYEPESQVGNEMTVNPNPFGEEDYAGTDPIYQNHANKTEQPLVAQEGAFKDAEDHVRSLHEDEEDAEDPGLGGTASLADTSRGGTGPTTYLVPGQEGYDREKAEEQQGPPMRVDPEEDEEEGSDETVELDTKSAPVPPEKPVHG